MKYMGSKNRHAKDILEIILSNRHDDQWFVEPFVGGANVIDKVQGLRLAGDSNPYLIALWQAVSDGWLPSQDYTEKDYNEVRGNKDAFELHIVGYFGFALSYAGKWFGGWCRDKQGERDYVGEAYRNALKQFPKLHGVQFAHKEYFDLTVPDGSIVYCDPPYADTTQYSGSGSLFDHQRFYGWCKELGQKGCTVFLSEYSAPDCFEMVWCKEVKSSLTSDTGSKVAVEKLFKLKGEK